ALLALCQGGCATGIPGALPAEPAAPAGPAAPVVVEQRWDPAAARAFLASVSDAAEGGSVDPIWHADGRGLSYLRGAGAAQELVWFDVSRGLERTVVSTDRVRGALRAELGGAALELATLAYEPVQRLVHGETSDNREFVYDPAGDRLVELGKPAPLAEPRLVRPSFPIAGWDRYELPSPDGRRLATLKRFNLGLRAADGDAITLLTEDGSERVEYLFASDIWESSGANWSPDGRFFLGRRHDTRRVPGFPIVDYLTTPETATRFHYWARAGEPLPLTDFVWFDVADGAAQQTVGSGDHDHLALFVTWAPGSDEFVFLRFARDLSTLEAIAVDARSGDRRTLVTERAERGWVKWPGGPQTLTYLPSGEGFVWRSERDGMFRFYLYDRDGTLRHALTDGRYPVGELVAIDEAGGWLYYMAGSDPDHPYESHLHRVPLDGSADDVRLTRERGQHSISMAPDFSAFASEHSHLDRPPRTDLYRADGRFIATLAAAEPPADRRAWPAPEAFTALAADGDTVVHGLIFKPHDFDPSRRYPVIERIYGGMQLLAMRRGYLGHGLGYPGAEYYKLIAYLNHLGFAVVTMDTPGTPGRGRAFNLATHGRWPDGIINDHAAVLEQVLADRPWLDRERVGVEGNSWGGQLAVRALTDAPQLYRSAVATVPETDLLDHVHWIEFQNGTPAANPDAYRRGTPALAERIDGDLLLIHGTSDANVPVSNTMKLADALISAGKPFELLIVPGANHSLQAHEERYSYAVERMARFFLTTLGQPR
ncbi:MAG: alpha/beta fold hydrolase, partial [Pseudomonadota bacterium]